MTYLMTYLASFMPGMKTKILGAVVGGSSAILMLLQYLQTIDLSQFVSPTYMPVVTMVLGALTYLAGTLRNFEPPKQVPAV